MCIRDSLAADGLSAPVLAGDRQAAASSAVAGLSSAAVEADGGAYATGRAVLWDQSDYDVSKPPLNDQEFGDYAPYSAYLVTDVVSTGWVVQTVTTYFTYGFSGSSNWPVGQNITARLNIIPRDGCALPDDSYNPADGTEVTAQLQLVAGNTLALVADGLNIDVPAGEYWVGLTPVLAYGTYGQEFHRAAPIIGCNTVWRNPGNGYEYGPNWIWAYQLGYWENTHDAAIKIEGIGAQPAGVCCHPDGTCEETTEENCPEWSIWQASVSYTHLTLPTIYSV